MTTQTSPTGGHHLSLLYHSSHHHHHHHSLQPQLPAIRRPSRLPAAVYTRPPEIKAFVLILFYRIFIGLLTFTRAFNYNIHHVPFRLDIKCSQRHCQLYMGNYWL